MARPSLSAFRRSWSCGVLGRDLGHRVRPGGEVFPARPDVLRLRIPVRRDRARPSSSGSSYSRSRGFRWRPDGMFSAWRFRCWRTAASGLGRHFRAGLFEERKSVAFGCHPGRDPASGSEARMSAVINCVAYEAGRRRAEVDLKQACPAEADGSFIWVGLHEPDKELLRTVQQRFGLHDLAIEDALLAHQRPKLEIYGDSVFIALRTAQLVDTQAPVRRDAHLRRARLRGHGAPRLDHRLPRGARALRRRAEDAGDGRELRRLFDHRLHRRQLPAGAARRSRPRPTRWRRKSSPARATGPTSNASTSCGTNCCCCAAPCSRCRRCATASCATTCR